MENIKKYLDLLSENELVNEYNLYGKEETSVEHITYASGDTKPGTLFVCKGSSFKEAYLADAISKGAVVYVSDERYESSSENTGGSDVPYIIVSDVRKAMPLIAKMFYEDVDEKLTIIGLTGTKGKTTTAYYIKAILDDYLKAEGKPASAILSSIETYDGVSTDESMITTPESFEIFRHFNNAVNSGIEYITMEVSSQALKYGRSDGIMFDIGLFLNISEDHISPIEHTDFKDYFDAKLKIFKQTKAACINSDTENFHAILDAADGVKKTVIFGINGSPDILGRNIEIENGVISFDAHFEDLSFDRITLAMPGTFNVENALAAIAATRLLDIPVKYMRSGLARATVAGRMELYQSDDGVIRALVDYAHNRLSYQRLYDSVLEEHPGYEIVTVFGCPGGKAKNRRSELGTIAGQYSQKVILVPEDPNMEDPAEISKEIGKYLDAEGCPYEYYEDRAEGISKTIAGTTQKSIFLVLGKGTEDVQKSMGAYVPFIPDGVAIEKGLEEYASKIKNQNHY